MSSLKRADRYWLCKNALAFSMLLALAACKDADCPENPTDQDFIDSAVAQYLTFQHETATRFHADAPAEQVSMKLYESVADFYLVNPACCHFEYRGEEGEIPNFLRRFWYDYAGAVHINDPKLREITSTGIVLVVTSDWVVWMNSCAKPYKS